MLSPSISATCLVSQSSQYFVIGSSDARVLSASRASAMKRYPNRCIVRKIVGPILSSDSAGVYQVREVVFGVRDYDVRVADGVVVAAPHRLSGGRQPGRSLCRVDGRLAAGQTDKAFVEAIEPRAQDAWL